MEKIIEVIDSGLETTVQDYPGRLGYWYLGIPPSGPFDGYAFRLGNLLVGNPVAGGMGLNLLGYDPNNPDGYTTNCNHMIYFSQGWSYVARDQSESRPHRRGTRVNVRITDLTVPDTIDEEIRARVTDKKLHALTTTNISDLLRKLLS